MVGFIVGGARDFGFLRGLARVSRFSLPGVGAAGVM